MDPMIRSLPTRLLVGLAIAVLTVAAITTPSAASEAASGSSERAAIERLYLAAFNRAADSAGLSYWHTTLGKGIGLDDIADYFVGSVEFQARYGTVSNEELVTLIYHNVLDRPPDRTGLVYWVGLLDRGHSAGTILNGFAQSPEFVRNQIPTPPPSILMIGDSILHGIKVQGIPVGSADLRFLTEEGRQAHTLPDLIEEAAADGSLAGADLVVIHLGTNGWLAEYGPMFDRQLAQLAPKPVLIVNTEVARQWETVANDALAAIAAGNPNANLVDWNGAVAHHPEWMRPDGVHPTVRGLEALAALIESEAALIY